MVLRRGNFLPAFHNVRGEASRKFQVLSRQISGYCEAREGVIGCVGMSRNVGEVHEGGKGVKVCT